MTSTTPHQLPVGFVGRYLTGGTAHFLPTSDIEIARAVPSAVEILRGFNFAPNRYVLICGLIEETAQFLPIEYAINQLRLIATNADATLYEGTRVEAILRRFDVAAVIGLNSDLLRSLQSLGHDPGKALAGKVVWARPDAYAELQGQPQGFTLLRWAEFGPAVGLECKFAAGVHVDSQEWELEENATGEILVSSRVARCLPIEKVPTGMRGGIERSPCRCGTMGVRVVL